MKVGKWERGERVGLLLFLLFEGRKVGEKLLEGARDGRKEGERLGTRVVFPTSNDWKYWNVHSSEYSLTVEIGA